MFTVNGKTKHPSLKLFVERYRKFPLKVQEGIEVILTEGLPYTPSKRMCGMGWHGDGREAACCGYLVSCRASEFVGVFRLASTLDEDCVGTRIECATVRFWCCASGWPLAPWYAETRQWSRGIRVLVHHPTVFVRHTYYNLIGIRQCEPLQNLQVALHHLQMALLLVLYHEELHYQSMYFFSFSLSLSSTHL